MSSKIYDCDASEEFIPSPAQIVDDQSLFGTTLKLDIDQCYLAVTQLSRVDGRKQLFIDSQNTKRIYVMNTGEPPYFLEQP